MESKSGLRAGAASDEPIQSVDSGIVMPRFDGHGSLRRFLDDFERYGKLRKWTDEQMLNVLPLSLTGIARDAFDSLSADETSTFQRAAAGLRGAFASKTVAEHHLTLRDLKFSPDESLDSFVIRFRKLMSLAFPTLSDVGPLMFSHFLATLPAELHAAVIADGISSFDDAVRKVRNLIASQAYLTQTRPSVVRRLDSDAELARLSGRVADLEAAVGSAVQLGRAPERRRGQDTRVCLCCGGRGHVRDRCRLRARACYRCQSVGHLAVMCPQSPPSQGNVIGSGRRERGGPPPGDRTVQTQPLAPPPTPPSHRQM